MAKTNPYNNPKLFRTSTTVLKDGNSYNNFGAQYSGLKSSGTDTAPKYNVKTYDKLSSNDKYKALNEFRKSGIIDKDTQLKFIEQIGKDVQNKTKTDFQKSIKLPGQKQFEDISTSLFKVPVEQVARTVQNVYKFGEAKSYNDVTTKLNKSVQDGYKLIDADLASGKINEQQATEARAKGLQLLNNWSTKAASKTKTFSSIDKTRAAADAAGTFLSIADLLSGKTILKSAVGGTVKTGAKAFAKNMGGRIFEGAGINAAQMASQVGSEKGSSATAQDYLSAAGTGALWGGATAGVVTAAGPAFKALGKGKDIVESKLATVSKNIGDTELGKALNAAKNKVGTLIDKNQYIYDALKGVKDGKQTASEVVRGLTTDVKQAAGVAKAIREESGQLSDMGKLIKEQATTTGRTVKEVSKDLTDFISAKQTAINKAKVAGTVADVVTGTPAQERAYELLNQATKPFVKRAFDAGLIDEVTFNKYMADNNYTRVQRELEDTISIGNKGGGDTSVSSTTFGQKLTGSNKKTLNPVDSFVDWSNKIETEIAKNTKAKYVTDKLLEAGKAKQLVNVTDVSTRKALYGEANQTRVLVKELDKTLKSQSKYIKNIKSEIDSIKGSGKVAVTNELKKTLKEIFPTNKDGVIDLKAAAEKIKNIDSAEIRSLKKQLGARDSKLIKALDDIQSIKEQHLQASKDLQDVISQAKALADDSATGKFTLSRFTNGIKEVFETDPNIVKSVKNMDKAYLGAIGKFISYPSKVLQRGATALNAAFPLPNFIKDQISSFILSKHGTSTHNPISFWQGLKEGALKPSVNAAARGLGLAERNVDIWKPSKLFSDWSNKNAGITLVELSRDAKSVARQAAEEMGLKGPSLMRKAESVVSATENMTRYQNFFGEYKNAIKKGSSTDEAFKLANQAARENSVDFSQVGELNEFGKIFNPYMNASIQGSRSLVRALKERPVATGIKIAATVLAPVAASTYYNMADPNRALIYTQIPDYEKESNLIFVMSNGSYLKFPLPIGVKEFANPLRNLITSEYVGDRDGFLETANNLMVKPFNPFNLGDIVPVPIKPLVENMANYSFFTGEPIVGKNLKDLPANEQTYKSTSQLYKDIGGVLGVSPLQVKNTIKGYGAGGAEQIVSAIDKARGLTNKNITAENRDTISQIVKRFYGEKPSETGNAVVDRFYKEYTPLSAQSNSTSKKITALLKKKKDSEAKKLANDFNKKVEAANTKYKTTYGTYMKDSELLDTLNNLKIDLTPKSISRRKKQD